MYRRDGEKDSRGGMQKQMSELLNLELFNDWIQNTEELLKLGISPTFLREGINVIRECLK